MHARRARPDEAPLLSQIAAAAKAHWGYPAEVLAGWRAELTISADDVASMDIVVAARDGEVLGFYALAVGVALGLGLGPSQASLEHLWVDPGHMRRGVGRFLVEHAVAAAGAGGATSVLIDADPNAERFYLGLGAERIGDIPAPILGDPGRVRPQLVMRVPSDADRINT
jgi:GNAT superfamily N-acetyltransferase